MSVLTTTTGLFCIFVLHIDRFCECLLVSNLRCTHIRLDFEFTEQTVNNDFQMKFAHSGDNCLACLLIRMRPERRVLLRQLCESFAHLALSGLCLRLNCKLDYRLREFHGLQYHRMLVITDGIARCCEFKSHCSCDISGVHFIQLLTLVRVHLENTSNALFPVFCRIQHVRTGLHRSRVDTEECKLTNERIRHNLECKCRKRFLIR